MTTKSAVYVFGGERDELERLLGQAEDLKPESSWLLDQIGIIDPAWVILSYAA